MHRSLSPTEYDIIVDIVVGAINGRSHNHNAIGRAITIISRHIHYILLYVSYSLKTHKLALIL